MAVMAVRSIKVTLAQDVEVELPEGAFPLNFIKQGTQGLFLWYAEFIPTPPPNTNVLHKFHFIGKDGIFNNQWTPFGVIKSGKYYQVFKE